MKDKLREELILKWKKSGLLEGLNELSSEKIEKYKTIFASATSIPNIESMCDENKSTENQQVTK